MSGKKSKDKGAAFERKVAKILSDAYGIELTRTPLSGGWAVARDDVAGDIVSADDDIIFAYCVECKKEEGWTLDSLLTDSHAWFDRWWAQLIDECPEGKDPLLVFSRNYMPIFVAGTVHTIGQLDPHLRIVMEPWTVIVTTLERFLIYDTSRDFYPYYRLEVHRE